MTDGSCDFSAKATGSNRPSASRHPKYPEPTSQIRSPPRAQVIRADAALAGVVGEPAPGGAAVECLDGLRGQCSEAHRRNVEHRNVIRLRAVRTAEPHLGCEVVGEAGSDGVPQVLVADGVDVAFRAERFVALGALGPLVDEVAGFPVEGRRLRVGFDEVLADLRADQLHEEPDVTEDRIDPQDGVPGLHQIPGAQPGQRQQDDGGTTHHPDAVRAASAAEHSGQPHSCDDHGPHDHRVRVARVTPRAWL